MDVYVTVAKASEILTAQGDVIDPSNVSRYLARNPTIPSERRGKCRMVDLAALILHRRDNAFVADKRAARGTAGFVDPGHLTSSETARLAERLVSAKKDTSDFALQSDPIDDSGIGDINRQLKLLELQRRQREEDVADGKLVPAHDVEMLICAAMRSMISEFERHEVTVAQMFGKDVAIEFRKARKQAQSVASGKLAELAKSNLPTAGRYQNTDELEAQEVE